MLREDVRFTGRSLKPSGFRNRLPSRWDGEVRQPRSRQY
jgi:hypothetical protein